MDPNLVTFGRELARAQDEQAAATLDLERGRARLLKRAAAQPRRWPVVALAAAAIAVAAAWLLWLRERPPLEFHVGGAGIRGQLGEPLSAPANAQVRLDFSDGSRLELLANSRARVVRTDPRGATVRVDHGMLRAAVAHRKDSQWQVQMGPFLVDVVGTRFDTTWHAETQRFTLTLHEGAVSVSGPVVGPKRTVSAGEQLSISCLEGELALVTVRSAASRGGGTELGAPVVPDAAALAPKPTPPIAAPAASSPSAPSLLAQEGTSGSADSVPDFRELARANEYARALDAAERAGFDALCRTASAADLLLLGDAARLAGEPARAEQAYRAVRERFGGASAAQAAFLLGRLAFESRSAYADAAQYFALSLLEQPSGPFARDAAGRLMESLDRAGDATGAKAAAERYAARYPDGPHASLASALLARP